MSPSWQGIYLARFAHIEKWYFEVDNEISQNTWAQIFFGCIIDVRLSFQVPNFYVFGPTVSVWYLSIFFHLKFGWINRKIWIKSFWFFNNRLDCLAFLIWFWFIYFDTLWLKSLMMIIIDFRNKIGSLFSPWTVFCILSDKNENFHLERWCVRWCCLIRCYSNFKLANMQIALSCLVSI